MVVSSDKCESCSFAFKKVIETARSKTAIDDTEKESKTEENEPLAIKT